MPEQEVVEQTEQQSAATEEVQQAETPAESETALPEKEEGKPQGGFQRRIDKLTREKHELLGVTRELRDRIASIETKLAAKPAAEQAQEIKADPKPDAATWTGTHEELVEALSRWAVRQEHRTIAEKERKEAETADQQERDREVFQAYQDRVNDFVEEHDDFNETVGKIRMSEDVGMSIQVAMYELEEGPAVAYYLGQHPEVCKKMSDMTPAAAVAYLGRIAAKIAPEEEESQQEETQEQAGGEESEPSPKPTTAVKASAPAPIKPIRKVAPTAQLPLDDPRLSFKEYCRRRDAAQGK